MKPHKENYVLKRHPREIYPAQSRVKKKIISHLKKNILSHPCIKRAYLLGSLEDGNFGKYTSPKEDRSGNKRLGSDIDLLIFADELFKLPSDWKEGIPDIFDRYSAPALNGISGIEDNIHVVSLFVYFPSKANLPPADKRNKRNGPYAQPTREKALEFILNMDNPPVIYKKKPSK